MTKFQEWPDADVDVLCGGTPCQSFSVAGLRKGLADPRGNLMLTFGAIAGRYRPRWLVWENVPGVLSSNGGRDFGTFLGMLGQLGYGFAYRVLDAQHVRTRRFPRAVPQRRRRVFVVGYLGDWRRAAAVLFDRESLRGDTPPRREAGQGAAPTLAARTRGSGGLGTDFDLDGGLIPRGFGGGNTSGPIDVAARLTAKGQRIDFEVETMVVQAIAFDCKGREAQVDLTGATPTLRAMGHAGSHANAGGQLAVAFDMRGREGGAMLEGPHDTANIRAADGGSSRSYVATRWAVRRLTPTECEALQGFPKDFTRIPYRGNPAESCPDGPRYKALGNSWAVNVAEWVGERINEVDGWAMEAASCPRARKASRTVPENSQATSTLIAPAPVTAAAASSGSRRGRTQPSQAIRASRF
jgi:DNA (cytosine-5)-methyltransferase 1